MTLSLKVVLIVISILTCFYIARKLRKSQMNINDTVFWIFFAIVLVLLSVFPGIASWGAVGLLIIALIPIMCTGFFNASVSFGGTSIIIIVGVVLETLKQIESQMCNRYYKGFLSE